MTKLKTVDSYQKNFENILNNTLSIFGITVGGYFIKWLKSNSLYPSLSLMEKAFRFLNFSTLIVKIEPIQLKEIPLPAVAILNDSEDKFVVVTKADEQISYHDSVDGTKSIDLSSFVQKWSGIVLLLEEPEKSTSTSFYSSFLKKENNKRSGLIMLLLMLSVLIGSMVLNGTSIGVILYGILSIFGIGVCIYIKSLETNILSMSVCSIGKNIDCNSVLNSKGAIVFKGLKASDLGFFWYVSMFMYCFLFGYGDFNYTIWGYLGILSLIYVPYSLIYQGLILKKWCLFCLAVQFLIILHFIHALNTIPALFESRFDFGDISPFIFSFIFSCAITYLYKIFLNLFALDSQSLQSRNLFALDKDVFYHMTSKEPVLETDLSDASIKLFDENSKVELTMVINPECEGCKSSFKELMKLYKINSGISLNIVLVKKWHTKGEEQMFRMILGKGLDERFNVLRGIMLNEDYESKTVYSNTDELMEKHKVWVEKSDVEFTPTFFIDGKKIPSHFQIDDIIYHLFEKHY